MQIQDSPRHHLVELARNDNAWGLVRRRSWVQEPVPRLIAKAASRDLTERDSLTDWFHALSGQSHDQLLKLASPETIAKFRLHATRSVPSHPLPDDLSASAFAEAVAEIRQNERAWNQATMAALAEADDLFNAGDSDKAVTALEAFAACCPWVLFQEVALDQASHYR